MSTEPYCYLAFKGKEFGGVIDPGIDRDSLAEFLIEMIEDGNTIKPLYHPDEYNSAMAELTIGQ